MTDHKKTNTPCPSNNARQYSGTPVFKPPYRSNESGLKRRAAPGSGFINMGTRNFVMGGLKKGALGQVVFGGVPLFKPQGKSRCVLIKFNQVRIQLPPTTNLQQLKIINKWIHNIRCISTITPSPTPCYVVAH